MVSMHKDIVDSETYMAVLEHDIIPIMNPWPGVKSVLILDNAPVHNKPAIMSLCQANEVSAIFLEPYRYEYNPIGLVFLRAEYHLRKTWLLDDPRCPVINKTKDALENCIDGDTACNFFVHCHVDVTAEERERANEILQILDNSFKCESFSFFK